MGWIDVHAASPRLFNANRLKGAACIKAGSACSGSSVAKHWSCTYIYITASASTIIRKKIRSIAVPKYTVRYTPLLNTSSSCKLPSHLHPKTWRQCYISLFIGSISLNYNSKLLDKFKGTSMYPLRWALVCLCFHTHWIMLIHQLFWSVDVVMMDQKSLNIIVPVPCVTTAFVRNVSRYVWYFAEEIEMNNPSLRY